jgi:hypothetical protein
VLYAPTWSPESSLNTSGESIIASLARLGGNVIVKLHDRSYDMSVRASGGIDWRTRIERICRAHGAHLAQDPDVARYLFVADALVTDHSSVGFEFMLLDRPIVVVDCPQLLEHARVSADKVAWLRNAAAVVSADAVGGAVQRSLSDPSELSTRRRQIAAALFYEPGGATARAVQSIYALVGASLPGALPTAAPSARSVNVTPVLAGCETRST